MRPKSNKYDLHEMRRTALISFGETSQVDLTHPDCFNLMAQALLIRSEITKVL